MIKLIYLSIAGAGESRFCVEIENGKCFKNLKRTEKEKKHFKFKYKKS
jgi:hypothetical protein